MTKIFSFALGNIWRWTKSKNKNILIDYVRKSNLDINGVEITFTSKEELYSLKLSGSNRSWLRNLEYVTIHAPFKLAREARDEKELIKQLDIISELYQEIKAKNVIIHPQDLPEPEILKRYNFNVSTENLRPKAKISIFDLRKIFNKYPRMKLCLDVSHAYVWSKDETEKLVKNFKDRISQVHFSGAYRKRDHQSLRGVTKNFLDSIQPIKKLKIPIVIEEDIKTKSLQYLKEEIKYIRKMFES